MCVRQLCKSPSGQRKYNAVLEDSIGNCPRFTLLRATHYTTGYRYPMIRVFTRCLIVALITAGCAVSAADIRITLIFSVIHYCAKNPMGFKIDLFLENVKFKFNFFSILRQAAMRSICQYIGNNIFDSGFLITTHQLEFIVAPLSQHPNRTRKNWHICLNYGLIKSSRIPEENSFGFLSLTRKR